MTPRGERLWRITLWAGAVLLGIAAVSVAAIASFHPPSPRPLPPPAAAVVAGPSKVSAQELDAFAKKKMSRAIVKVAPPPPAKPVLPPLDMVVRLSGIIDYGPGSPREAFIEIRQTAQTKSYREGDAVPAVGAVVKAISDGVVMEYDGKLWKLTDRGASPASLDPVSSAGTKP